MTKKYLVSVVENICSGPGAARSVKRLQVCSPCSALAPNLGPAVGCWRLVTATIQPPEPEPERERAIVTVITNAGNIKCIIFTQLVILDHLWFWPWFINRLSQLLNWRNMYGMVCVRLVPFMFGFILLSSAQYHYHQSPSHRNCSVCSIQIFKVSTISTLVVNQPGIATHATGHPTRPTFHIMTSHIHSLIITLLLYFLIRLKYFSKSGDIFQVLSDAAT